MKTQSTSSRFMAHTRQILFIGLLAGIFSLTGTEAEAQRNGGMLLPSLYGEEMGLSDAQKREIAEIRITTMMQQRQQRANMQGNRNNRGNQGQRGMQNNSRMQRNNQQGGMMAGRNAIQSEILAVLTPEQRNRLDGLQQTRQAQRDDMQRYMIQARAGFMAEELGFNTAQAQELEDIMMAHHGEMQTARQQGRPSEATRQGHQQALHRKIEAAFGNEVYQRWAELFQPGSPRNNRQGNRR